MKKTGGKRMRLAARYIWNAAAGRAQGAFGMDSSLVKPVDVLCEITYMCNLKCPTCFRWMTESDKGELTAAEWAELVCELKLWLGTYNLSFGGGEPFLKRGFLDVVRTAAAVGVPVSAVSNGSLIDKELAKKIAASGLNALSLSLNSLTPGVHNVTRGVDDNFDAVMRAIKNLKERGDMRLTISTTATAGNMAELPDIVRFAADKGLDGINIQPLMTAGTFPAFDESGTSKDVPDGKLYDGLGKDAEAIDAAFARLIEMKQQGYAINNSIRHLKYMAEYLKYPAKNACISGRCDIAYRNFFVDPYGNVRICMIMEPVGSVREGGARSAWNSGAARLQRKAIRSCRKACRLLNCNFRDLDLFGRIRGAFR